MYSQSVKACELNLRNCHTADTADTTDTADNKKITAGKQEQNLDSGPPLLMHMQRRLCVRDGEANSRAGDTHKSTHVYT